MDVNADALELPFDRTGRLQVRAWVDFLTAADRDSMPVIATVEVFDNATGKTQLVYPMPAGHIESGPRPTHGSMQHFGMLGITKGQTARLNLVNPGTARLEARAGYTTNPPLRSEHFALEGGKSVHLDLNADAIDLPFDATGRLQVRAWVDHFTPSAGKGTALIATVEIFDHASGKTLVLVAAPAVDGTTSTFETPARLSHRSGMLGIIKGQTARLNVVNLGTGPFEVRAGYSTNPPLASERFFFTAGT